MTSNLRTRIVTIIATMAMALGLLAGPAAAQPTDITQEGLVNVVITDVIEDVEVTVTITDVDVLAAVQLCAQLLSQDAVLECDIDQQG